MYDSCNDTLDHIGRVSDLLEHVIDKLVTRQTRHDVSKLSEPEKSVFDEFTPKLKDSTYGSDEYKEFLKQMKPALDHHYAHNKHHPEHFPVGITGMSLIDLVEMFCDWKAATERHDNGNIMKSIHINAERFKINPQLKMILLNTVREMGW